MIKKAIQTSSTIMNVTSRDWAENKKKHILKCETVVKNITLKKSHQGVTNCAHMLLVCTYKNVIFSHRYLRKTYSKMRKK